MKINELKNDFWKASLVVPYKIRSKRDIAYPYILSVLIALAIILASIVRVGG